MEIKIYYLWKIFKDFIREGDVFWVFWFFEGLGVGEKVGINEVIKSFEGKDKLVILEIKLNVLKIFGKVGWF